MARAGRVAAVLAGCVVMAYGSWGLFLSHAVPHSANLLVWLAASVLGHDAVIAPVVFALCWAGTRLLPPRAKPWAAGALLVGGTALLVGLAALLGKGRDSNPTVLPLDYGRNILVVLFIVAAVATAAAGGAAAVQAARRATGPRRAAVSHGTVGRGTVRREREQPEDRAQPEHRAHREHRADHAADPGRRPRGNDSDERQP